MEIVTDLLESAEDLVRIELVMELEATTKTDIRINTNYCSMRPLTREKENPSVSTSTAALAGFVVGVGLLTLYIIGGFIFAQWSINGLLDSLILNDIVEFLLLSTMVIVALGGPVAAYLRLHVVTPLVTLGIVIIAWLSIGVGQGILQNLFGLAVYAAWFSPLYIAIYLIAGGVEFYIQD